MSLILSGTDGLSDIDGSAATPAIRGTDANTGIFFGADIIGFSEGGVEAMRITSAGDVGIGTSSPSTKLHVVGEITATQGLGGTPAVFAWANAVTQTFTYAVNNVIQLNAVSSPGFDTASCFNTGTYRFTPNVAGYYMITGAVSTTGYVTGGQYVPIILKNGSTIVAGGYSTGVTGSGVINNVSGLISMNGTTDYIQLGAFDGQSTGTRTLNSGSTSTYMMAYLARGA
jgi:hypothetical protein